jgi:hypothetical protein
MKKLLASLALASMVAAPALAHRDTPDVQLQKLLAGRVAGKPVSCLPFSQANDSRVINGKAIVYKFGGTLYVNQPRSGAEDLNDDNIIVTRQFGSQLCDVDSVHLIDRSTGFPRGFIILDKFVPYTKPKPSS